MREAGVYEYGRKKILTKSQPVHAALGRSAGVRAGWPAGVHACAAIPPVYAAIAAVYPAIPPVYAAIPAVYAAIPAVYAAIPAVYAVIPAVYAVIPPVCTVFPAGLAPFFSAGRLPPPPRGRPLSAEGV